MEHLPNNDKTKTSFETHKILHITTQHLNTI